MATLYDTKVSLGDETVNYVYNHLTEIQKNQLYNKIKNEKEKYHIYEREVVYYKTGRSFDSCTDILVGTFEKLDDVYNYIFETIINFLTINKKMLAKSYKRALLEKDGEKIMRIFDRQIGLVANLPLDSGAFKNLCLNEKKYYLQKINDFYIKIREYELCFKGFTPNTCFIEIDGGHWGLYWFKR